jgi:hypothetical protein
MTDDLDDQMHDLLWRLDEGDTVVTSVRQPAALRDAARLAVRLGMDATSNDAAVRALRERVEVFARRRALDAHYEQHPEARPGLAELALAAAELDGDPLARSPKLLERAAREVVVLRPDATADDVLLYAAALRSRTKSA